MASAMAITFERTFLKGWVGDVGAQPADLEGIDAPALEGVRA